MAESPLATLCSRPIGQLNSELGSLLQAILHGRIQPFREKTYADIVGENLEGMPTDTRRIFLHALTQACGNCGLKISECAEWTYAAEMEVHTVVEKILVDLGFSPDHWYVEFPPAKQLSPPSPQTSPRNYLDSALKGDVLAQYYLALSFDEGIGTSVDKIKARQWYLKAAEQGDRDAQQNLGLMCLRGEGGPADPESAVGWFNKSAGNGSVEALGSLASCYENGVGVSKDAQKAFTLYLRVAKRSERTPQVARAQFNVGVSYYTGDGVERDFEAALVWWRKAAELGHKKAKENLDYFNTR